MLSFFWPPHLPKIQEKIERTKNALEPVKKYLDTNFEYNKDLQFSDNAIRAAMLRSKLEFYNMILKTYQSELSEEVEAKIAVYETQLEHIYLNESTHSFKTLRALEDLLKITTNTDKHNIKQAIHICNKKITEDKSVAALLFEEIACLIGVGDDAKVKSLLETCQKEELQQYANLSLHYTKDSFLIKYKSRETPPSIEIVELLVSINDTYLSASEEDQKQLIDMYARHVKKASANVLVI